MTGKTNKLTEEQQKRNHEWWMTVTQGSVQLLKMAIAWLGIVACVYLGVYLPIEKTAGQTTTISYVLGWAVNLSIDRAVMLVLTGGSLVYGWKQGRTKRTEVAARDARIKEQEKRIEELTVKGNKP